MYPFYRPVFRSYKPQDANLQESQLPKPELTKGLY